MNKLKKIQYNCHKATFLIEKRAIQRLTFREMIELNIHLAGCEVCRIYRVQSNLINQLVHELLHSSRQQTSLKPEDKDAMHERIEEELNK